MLIDGVPGIVIAPGGRAQALLQIGVGDDNRIHTIDITGDADRLRRAVLTLPRWPISESPHAHRVPRTSEPSRLAKGQGERDAR